MVTSTKIELNLPKPSVLVMFDWIAVHKPQKVSVRSLHRIEIIDHSLSNPEIKMKLFGLRRSPFQSSEEFNFNKKYGNQSIFEDEQLNMQRLDRNYEIFIKSGLLIANQGSQYY